MGNIFSQLNCCLASWKALLPILPPSLSTYHATNFNVASCGSFRKFHVAIGQWCVLCHQCKQNGGCTELSKKARDSCPCFRIINRRRRSKPCKRNPKGLHERVDCFVGREGALPLACKGTCVGEHSCFNFWQNSSKVLVLHCLFL